MTDLEAPSCRIVCAAIRHPDGRIVCGPRHMDYVMWAQIVGMSPAAFRVYAQERQPTPEAAKQWQESAVQQGFIDQHGAFYNRFEAWDISDAAGQIIESERGWQTGSLHSEHLY